MYKVINCTTESLEKELNSYPNSEIKDHKIIVSGPLMQHIVILNTSQSNTNIPKEKTVTNIVKAKSKRGRKKVNIKSPDEILDSKPTVGSYIAKNIKTLNIGEDLVFSLKNFRPAHKNTPSAIVSLEKKKLEKMGINTGYTTKIVGDKVTIRRLL